MRRLFYMLLVVPGLVSAQQHILRYRPEGGDIVIENGTHRFNRALYGTHTAFRVETGDLPEFALYMPGMGGNLHFEIDGRPLIRARWIKAIYRPGSMLYEIRDPALGSGTLRMEVLALADAEGMVVRVNATGIGSLAANGSGVAGGKGDGSRGGPREGLRQEGSRGGSPRGSQEGSPRGSQEGLRKGLRLEAFFGGASGKKFSRDGDIGADPESSFDLDMAACRGDKYVVDGDSFRLEYAGGKRLEGVMPGSAMIGAGPIVRSDVPLGGISYLMIRNPAAAEDSRGRISAGDSARAAIGAPGIMAAEFAAAEAARDTLAGRVAVHTPDPYLNTLGGVLAVAADGIWEAPTYLHGAVAWRQRLPAWRGPYVADPLGWHDRARQHFSSYALSQLTSPPDGPVVADTALHLARQREVLGTSLFSSGYICRNPNGDFRPHHYDMNLVFIDQLLTHFYWTGDTAYVRSMWPVLARSLAWEKRNFDADGDGLYDAYACIWASDALEYGGGGVTHSSAYNYRANLLAADLARMIGEDPAPYAREAAHILTALNSRLWLPEQGSYAEYIDWGPDPLIHPAAGLWTIYQAIDSRVCDAIQAWECLDYVDRSIPHIPVRAAGLTDTSLFVLSTTNWQPYTWSINNVALAENLNMALAYWQGGRPAEGFRLWKSALVESMYMGSSPGNFEQLSSYDAARGELYRDFADPIGVAARSLVEGLFGIRPDALHDTLTITPGWPEEWGYASLRVPDITIDFHRSADDDDYRIIPAFAHRMRLRLRLRARSGDVAGITVNGRPVEFRSRDVIGAPMLEVDVPPDTAYRIVVKWGSEGIRGEEVATYSRDGRDYDELRQGRFSWWKERLVRRVVKVRKTGAEANGRAEMVPLGNYFNDSVTNIFKRQYLSPRPKVPTLQLPTQGIGNWCYPLVNANIDDSGLRALAASGGGVIRVRGRVPFATPVDGRNIVFTSRWDNYPDSVSIPLSGHAGSAWFLLAGSTNPMQSRIANGVLRIWYTDGTYDSLELVNPSNWWPIEEDYYDNGLAFTTDAPHPLRAHLKTGIIVTGGLSGKLDAIGDQPRSRTSIKGLTNAAIDGGAATVLEMSLQPGKQLDRLVVRTLARDVVVGLMSVTLIKTRE